MAIIVENGYDDLSSNLDEAFAFPIRANKLGKGMNPIIHNG